MDDFSNELDNALDAYQELGSRMGEIHLQIESLKKEEADLKKMLDQTKNRVLQIMEDSGCLDTVYKGLKWSIRRTPQSVIVLDEGRIPAEYMRTTTKIEPNKSKIKAAFDDGLNVPGATLSNGGITLTARSA